MNNSRSKVFDNPRDNGIQSKVGETSRLGGRGTLSSLWTKENLDAQARSWQALLWEDE